MPSSVAEHAIINHMDVAVFGDVGGHATQFFNALSDLGVDFDNATIPEDLTIVQVGDLIHKGPDSDLIVEFVNAFLTNSPKQWVQLNGNHELQHCYGIPFFPCRCTDDTVRTLRDWWQEGLLRMSAVIIHNEVNDLFPKPTTLITHAGVTQPIWKISHAQDAQEWSQWADDKAFYNLSRQSGLMLGEARNFMAGPIWAHCIHEVYESWNNTEMPFNQVHGHTAPYVWNRAQWFHVSDEWKAKIDRMWDINATRHVPTNDSGSFLAIDQTYESGKLHIRAMPYLMIENASVV